MEVYVYNYIYKGILYPDNKARLVILINHTAVMLPTIVLLSTIVGNTTEQLRRQLADWIYLHRRNWRKASKLNFASPADTTSVRTIAHARSCYSFILVSCFHYSYRSGEVLGFFEYSINVRKSYITSRECVRSLGRASHASDYFYLRPFVLAGGNEQAVFSFGLPSASSKDHPFSLPPILPSFFSFPSSRLPAFLASNQRIGSRLLAVGENVTSSPLYVRDLNALVYNAYKIKMFLILFIIINIRNIMHRDITCVFLFLTNFQRIFCTSQKNRSECRLNKVMQK